MSLYAQWRESFISKATIWLMEAEGVDLPYDEAHAFVTAMLTEYDRLTMDELFNDVRNPSSR